MVTVDPTMKWNGDHLVARDLFSNIGSRIRARMFLPQDLSDSPMNQEPTWKHQFMEWCLLWYSIVI